ncbi:MAG: hypothetical protein OJK14_11805 [Achromobacter sp.]|uniref:hypothetical protein n=1 Tax=Achromobacter sp. TaxID=134375 RepID=UPI00258E2E8F|nr:hypothetical protein [Achromobacter sp.]MCW0207774.1 hypothetical protein [Achromobacter sp.]
MTLTEAQKKAQLAIAGGLAGQVFTFALILIGLLASLAESFSYSPNGFSALSSNMASLGSYAITSIPGAAWIAPFAPRYYPGQLEGNFAFALVFTLFVGTTALRNWGLTLRREVRAVFRQLKHNQWLERAQNESRAQTQIDVMNVGNIFITTPTPKDWWTRPAGVVVLAVIGGLGVEFLAPMLK